MSKRSAFTRPLIFGIDRSTFIGLSTALLSSSFIIASTDPSTPLALASGSIFWCSFYWLFAVLCENNTKDGKKIVAGCPKGHYYGSIFHQSILCVYFFVVLVLPHLEAFTPELVSNFNSTNPNSVWLLGEWKPYYFIERQVHLSIIGYEFKDFFLTELSAGFVVHHVIAIGGCYFCLFSPCAGLVSLTAVIAEIGSAFYNLNMIYPGFFIPYVIIMLVSNVAAGYFSWIYVNSPAHAFFHWFYGTATVVLISIRTAGVAMAIKDECSKSK